MGWFLRPQKTGGGKRSSGGRGKGKAAGNPLIARWSAERTLRMVKVLGVIVGLAVAAGVWHYAQTALHDYARAHHARPITAEDVVIEDPPAWMPRGLDLEVRRLVAAQVGEDPVDNTTLRAAAGALRDWAWIEPGGVRQIKRLVDGRVSVDVRFRSPLAVIRMRDGYHLVSDEGVRLPALYTHEQVERMDVPVLVNVSAAPPRHGEAWPGEEVAAGLALVRFLAGEPFMEEVEAIDVSGRDARGRLRLALRTGDGAVLWGLPPGREQSIEPDARTKLHRLRRVVTARGSIDAGGKIVHLYGATVQVSQPGLDESGDSQSRLGAFH